LTALERSNHRTVGGADCSKGAICSSSAHPAEKGGVSALASCFGAAGSTIKMRHQLANMRTKKAESSEDPSIVDELVGRDGRGRITAKQADAIKPRRSQTAEGDTGRTSLLKLR
jgi:hypothetical protein